ncbi:MULTISPECIES: hypothetical protein [Caballeronia]|uniref:Antirestriction protein ArdR n=1 Tax=Caballeronia zhejiangensis TaxID=871203 RepID=A0A656QBD1_9BURK|nr:MULTISPECIES: hypothetical protein [Caballeronia]EKS72005.1 hypothetical protein BURK_009241 [Burkholderia sp. SJ98]KDR25512.1 hypothetical protein BG60_27980 [Caballeronia zhejiangensis]
MTPSDTASEWRRANGYVGRGGVVIVFRGNVQSWVNSLRHPEHWQPGCIAVDEEGYTWTTVAGDERKGALLWLPNDPL